MQSEEKSVTASRCVYFHIQNKHFLSSFPSQSIRCVCALFFRMPNFTLASADAFHSSKTTTWFPMRANLITICYRISIICSEQQKPEIHKQNCTHNRYKQRQQKIACNQWHVQYEVRSYHAVCFCMFIIIYLSLFASVASAVAYTLVVGRRFVRCSRGCDWLIVCRWNAVERERLAFVWCAASYFENYFSWRRIVCAVWPVRLSDWLI